MAKILYNYKTDGASLAWAQNNLRGEVMIHNILSRRCPESLPVPLVLASDFDPNNPIGAPFMVMSKMEGEDQWLAWAKLTLPQKVVITTAVHCIGSDLWTIGNLRGVGGGSYDRDVSGFIARDWNDQWAAG